MFLRKLCKLVPLSVYKSNVRYTSASFKYYQFLREKIPDADLEAEIDFSGGDQILSPPLPQLTDVEESKDPLEWAAVQRILPSTTVPLPPKHESYPTPSGWVPQTAKPEDNAYFVQRSRFHNFPIYIQIFDGGNRPMTEICKIDGDIWAFEADLRNFIVEKTGNKVYTQVDEVGCKIRVRGTAVEECTEFLLQKGF